MTTAGDEIGRSKRLANAEQVKARLVGELCGG